MKYEVVVSCGYKKFRRIEHDILATKTLKNFIRVDVCLFNVYP